MCVDSFRRHRNMQATYDTKIAELQSEIKLKGEELCREPKSFWSEIAEKTHKSFLSQFRLLFFEGQL